METHENRAVVRGTLKTKASSRSGGAEDPGLDIKFWKREIAIWVSPTSFAVMVGGGGIWNRLLTAFETWAANTRKPSFEAESTS